MRRSAFAAVIASSLIVPAMAADLPPANNAILPSPIASLYSWSGWYGGLQFGGVWDKSSWRLFSQTGSGFLYGGQLGFNYQVDQFVFGAEGDVS